MKVLFIGENIYKSKGGIVTVMTQILNDPYLNKKVNYIPVYTSGDDFVFFDKILGWSIAFIKILFYLPKVEIVHIHHAINTNLYLSLMVVRIVKLFKKKIILHNHAADFKSFYLKLSNRKKKFIASGFNKVEGSIVLSQSWLNWYSKTFPYAKWILLRNAINIPDNFEKYENKKEIILVYLSRVEERKGVFDLLEVLPKIKSKKNYHLFIGGNGDVGKLRKIIQKSFLSRKVTYLGYLKEKQKRDLLIKGDIFLLPSYDEGLPMALLEAMSYGNVSVSTYVGGIPEVIRNGKNGLLFNSGDKLELKNKIELLLNDDILRKELSVEARKTIIENYNVKEYSKKLFEIYENL